MNIQRYLLSKKKTKQNILFFKECVKVIQNLDIKNLFKDLAIIYDKIQSFTISEDKLFKRNKLLYKILLTDLFNLNISNDESILYEELFLTNENVIISNNNHILMYLLIDNSYYFHCCHIFNGWRSIHIYLYNRRFNKCFIQ